MSLGYSAQLRWFSAPEELVVGARRRYTAFFFVASGLVLLLQVFNGIDPNKRVLSSGMLDKFELLSSSLTPTQFGLGTIEATCGINLVCNGWHVILKKVASISITENSM